MSITTLWMVRHGPTHKKSMVGWSDVPADLSDTAQIARLHAALPHGPVVSSDLIRAIDTASAIQGARPRLTHDEALREIHFGDWELKRGDEVAESHPDLSMAFWDQPGDTRAPNGESWNELTARVSGAVDDLINAHRGGHIIIVAHFGAILTQVARARGIPAREAFAQKIDNLSLTELRHGPDGWSAPRVNHLP